MQGGTRGEGFGTRVEHRQERKRVDGGEGTAAARSQFLEALKRKKKKKKRRKKKKRTLFTRNDSSSLHCKYLTPYRTINCNCIEMCNTPPFVGTPLAVVDDDRTRAKRSSYLLHTKTFRGDVRNTFFTDDNERISFEDRITFEFLIESHTFRTIYILTQQNLRHCR